MREFTLNIEDNFDGKDIKFILKNYFQFSDKLITALKSDDGILLNGKKEFVIKQVKKGDFLKLTLPEKRSLNILPNDIPLDILYEDEDILAVNKPADMPTHPSIGHFEGTLANAVMHYFRDIPFTFRAVTRLDRDTSGVVVIAKNAAAADRLSSQLQSGDFIKEYTAVCVGIPKATKGTIDAPIKREKKGIIRRCIHEDGKRAVSNYEVISTLGKLSLIKLTPHTGRTHQLRLHLSHIGTPIYADFLYGEDIPGERIRLHCGQVEFCHPFSGRPVKITAPLPDDMNLENIIFREQKNS
ncbi:MAG: RluA family pseudouridine synthase [Clostridia bacterium]|nr:RluA family pseudouridine synthase [Clostridia bacterium]